MKTVTRTGDTGNNFSESTGGEDKDSIEIGRNSSGVITYGVKCYGEGDLLKLLERACAIERQLAERYPPAKKEAK